MSAYETIEEFASKIDWEGGIDSAIRYGLKASDLADKPEHEQFKQDWAALSEAYLTAHDLGDQFYAAHLEGLGGWYW